MTDEPLLEAGLRVLLGEGSEFELVSVSQTPSEILQAAAKLQPELVLCALRADTDLALPELRRASARSVIVVLGRDITPEFTREAMEMGVRGFVSSTEGLDVLRECLRAAARGELWMDRSLSMALLDARPISLSKRQSQLVRLLAQGLKNKEIASALEISESTVKAYLTVLFEKVGAKDRFELALFGLKNLKNVADDSGLQDWRKGRPVRSFVPRKTDKQPAA
ncbi:MAG TPA: response regulator transcription factor [Bryobacteraceae bacterium]|nr:response regulator transcription factor [Bryobacteraceae bacterium]